LALDEADEEKPEIKETQDALIDRLKKTLGEQVDDVRVSKRLVDSPACLVTTEEEMSLHLQRLLKEAGQAAPTVKPILEINPQHQLLQRAANETDEAHFEDIARVLLGQAALAEGGQLSDAADFVTRLNRLLV